MPCSVPHISVSILPCSTPDTESAVQAYIRREGEAPAQEDVYDKTKDLPPVFRTHIKNLALKENDSAHFECRLAPFGDPTMKVEWFKDGEPLLHGKKSQV